MLTNRKTCWLAAALLAAALLANTGCGFFCVADFQCKTTLGQCCRNFSCTDLCLVMQVKDKLPDSASADAPPDFTDLLRAIFPLPG